MDVVVTGAGGFIGGHLVASLLAQGKSVRGVDVKPLDEWHQLHPEAESIRGDVSLLEDARAAVKVFMHAFVQFAVEDRERGALLFHRPVPGFEPSSASYEDAQAVLAHAVALLRSRS